MRYNRDKAAIKQMFAAAKQKAVEFKNKVASGVKQGAKTAAEVPFVLAFGVKELVSMGYNAAKNKINQGINAIKNGIKRRVNKVTTKVSNGWNKVKNFGKKVWKGVKTAAYVTGYVIASPVILPYKAALNDLKNNPNSPEAQANFDKAAMEMAKADVDKTEAVLKQEIRGLNEESATNQEKLEKLGLQHSAYEQEHGSLKSIEKDMVKLGLDPNKLPEDTSNLSQEAQELILHHKNLTQYQSLESQLQGRIDGVEQEISARKEILHDLHSRHEETAGNAVNQHVAGYESYEGSHLQDLNEKIAVESSAHTQDNAPQNQTEQTPPSKPEEKVEDQTPPSKPEEKVEDQTPPSKPEEKVEEQTPPTKPEEKVEEQTAEQDPLKDFSWDNVPPKDIHQCGSGIYTISGDENRYSMHYDRIIITSNDSNEFRAKLTVETDGENFYINGLKQENSDSYIDKGMIAQELALGEKIYDDLQARTANGETLGAAERTFMNDHEADLKSYGLMHDKDGNVVTIAEEQARATQTETQSRLDAAKQRMKIGDYKPQEDVAQNIHQPPKTVTSSQIYSRNQGNGMA